MDTEIRQQIASIIDSLKTSGVSTDTDALVNNLNQIPELLERLPRLFPKYRLTASEIIEAEKSTLLEIGSDRGTIFIAVTQLEVVCSNYLLIQFEKLNELLSEFCNALSRNKILTASMLARAVHEMAAFNCYISNSIEKKLITLEKQIEPTKIIKNAELIVKFVQKAFYGSSSNATGLSFIDIKNGRDELRKHWSAEASCYNRLCDFVHPNYGSNVLFGNGALHDLKASGTNKMAQDQLLFLAAHLPLVAEQTDLFLRDLLARVAFFYEIKDKVKREDIKIQNLFKNRKSRNENITSGKSFDEAFDLSDFKSPEAIKAEYRMIEKLGLKVKSRYIDSKDGVFYDVFKTNKYDVYFKLSIPDNF